MGKVFLGCHMVWFGSLVGVRLASARITPESLTCVGKRKVGETKMHDQGECTGWVEKAF